jgi:predicted AlkP superfamily phosphohydrolase/phosphomutase
VIGLKMFERSHGCVFYVATACLAAALFLGCGGGGEGEGGVPVVEEIRFDDWDAFVDSEERGRAGPRHVVVIGIDGAAWHFVNRLIERGDMPNLARLKKEGAYAGLVSTRSYVTPPAWTTMFTGYLPGETGVYSFGKWVRETEQFLTVNADDVKVPFVWDAASRAGMKVGVFNVPMTWPVHTVNGAVVSGMMTPIEAVSAIKVTMVQDPRLKKWFKSDPAVRNFSAPLKAAIVDSLNAFLMVMHDVTDDKVRNYQQVSLRILSNAAADASSPDLGLFKFPIGEYSQWLTINYGLEGKVVPAWSRVKVGIVDEDVGGNELKIEFSQTLFPIEAPYTHPEELREELEAKYGYYLPTKFLSKEVVPTLTEDMSDYASFLYDYDDWDLYHFVITQSDNMHHLVGFGGEAEEVYRIIDGAIGRIMDKLPEGSTLIVASDHGNAEFEVGIDLNQFFSRLKLLEWKTPTSINHENTLAFHNLWHVYFNHDKITREELSKRGLEVPAGEEPYEYLIRFVTEAGRQLRAPDGSRAFPVEFVRVEDRKEKDDPDMWVVGSYGDYICDYWNIMKPHNRMLRVLEGSDQWWHAREGIFVAWGDNIRRGYDAGSKNIQDVGPTMLYMAGLPVAPDMDGELMLDIFRPNYLANRPLFINNGYRDIPKETVLDAEDRESLQKKLKSLGYIQ